MKIALHTLGCKLNFAESSTYRRGFVSAGVQVVPWSEVADAYLINTCAVTEHSEKKSRNLIFRAHRLSPWAPVFVTGCYGELRREQIEAFPGVKKVFGAGEKSQIVPEVLSCLGVAGTGKSAGGEAILEAYSSGDRTRAFLKVQDGCDNFCAYCTVPFARGRSRNIPICSLVRQAEEIAASGIKEIVLTGVNTGDFGRSTGESFLSLLQALEGVEGIERYRISSIEPNLLTDEIIDWIASGTKFQPHFHIPLQSGSDVLLRRVGRRYDTALFASRIDRIREKMGPCVFFGIDVIVGLPGETDELFEETYRFLSDVVRPAFIHIFPYSKRPGTRAASFPDQVRDSVKTDRVQRLEELNVRLQADFREKCRGLRETVLWESSNHSGYMEGYTGNYIRLAATYDASRVGKLEETVIQ